MAFNTLTKEPYLRSEAGSFWFNKKPSKETLPNPNAPEKFTLVIPNNRPSELNIVGSANSRALTKSKLERLLAKDTNPSVIAAEVQADATYEHIGLSHSYLDDFKAAVQAHIDSIDTQYPLSIPAPQEAQKTYYQKVLKALDTDGISPIGRDSFLTKMAENGRFGATYRAARRNLLTSPNTPEYEDFRTYTLLDDAGTPIETVRVRQKLAYWVSDDSVVFMARTGVENSLGENSVGDLVRLLDQYRSKAINAPTKLGKATAIAEFEWIHSVTSPSGFGGGTVLAMQDYKYLQELGFKIPETQMRRIELEALSMSRDQWMNFRVRDLMNNYFVLIFLKGNILKRV